MQSYDYATRKGVEEISWERFSELAAQVAEKLAQAKIDVIIGVARAGLFPATAAACMLRCEFFPVRITRRVNDQVTYNHPAWKVDVSPEVDGKRVAVIDEIADSGETLALVAGRVKALGATRVLTACLVSHSWAKPTPDVVALVSDALILFPWDRSVYVNGEWQLHPELIEALKAQYGDTTDLNALYETLESKPNR
jgi:hypoxanthine phosphoribosyltransferase